MSTREELIGDLGRIARRHGWVMSRQSLGYYGLRFIRSDGTILVRIGTADRISEVVVDIGGNRHKLSLPARQRLEEILTSPVTSFAEPDPHPQEKLISHLEDAVQMWSQHSRKDPEQAVETGDWLADAAADLVIALREVS